MLSTTTIERVKDTPIYDIVSRYVTGLKKSGPNSYTALSPFTNEKTPSFYVVPSKDIFKCFSTGKGGDAIRFVMELNNMTFVDAIIDICGKLGEPVAYEVSEKATEEQTEKETLYTINRAAAKRFAECLLSLPPEHAAVQELTGKRQFTNDTLLQWQIGYAPTHPHTTETDYRPGNWRFLTEILHEKGLIIPALKIGLVHEKDKTVYDTFRNRIMFPIHNHLGRIVGFGGRWLGEKDKYNPKYINSADSVLYNKNSVLFGLHFAGTAIRKVKWAALVEGYTDVISFHQAGHENTVGTGGTALTAEQCALLKKYTDKVILFPDNDANDAGENSAMRNIDLLMAQGFETAVVPMPKGEGDSKIDPDELVRMFAALADAPEKKVKPVKKKK